MMRPAASSSARWENAWGRLPRWRQVGYRTSPLTRRAVRRPSPGFARLVAKGESRCQAGELLIAFVDVLCQPRAR